jgi:hypothetical protein
VATQVSGSPFSCWNQSSEAPVAVSVALEVLLLLLLLLFLLLLLRSEFSSLTLRR